MTELYKYAEYSGDETRVRNQVMKMSHRYAHVKETEKLRECDVSFSLICPEEMAFGKDGIVGLQ